MYDRDGEIERDRRENREHKTHDTHVRTSHTHTVNSQQSTLSQRQQLFSVLSFTFCSVLSSRIKFVYVYNKRLCRFT